MSNIQLTRKELIEKFFVIYWYRKYLDFAARDILGLELSPHHRLTLRRWGQQAHYCLLLCGRGMGKTVLAAIYYVLVALLYPQNKLMCLGGTGYRGSKIIMLEMEKIILSRLASQKGYNYARASLIEPSRVINRDPSFWTISFKNGSQIFAVPLGYDGSKIRGLRAYGIVQDEAFMLPSHLVQAVLEPMLNVLFDPTKAKENQPIKAQSIKTSTIDFSYRDFYKEYQHYRAILENPNKEKEYKIGSETVSINDISVFEFNFEDAFYYTKNGELKQLWGIDQERILEKKKNKQTDLEVWLAENKNIPMDVSGNYFSYEAINDCQNFLFDEDKDLYPEALDLCDDPCILGIDTAPSSANSAFVVIRAGLLIHKKKERNQVIFAHEENKMTQRKRIEMIYSLIDRYNLIAIAIDFRGGGAELADLLKDYDYIIHTIGPNAQPLYDPLRHPDATGMPILTLYSTTMEMNMIFNAYLKALLSNQNMLLPKPLFGRSDNQRTFISCGHIETLVSQLIRIKAIPFGRGLKFDIDSVDPDTGKRIPGKKDLYSALLYATGKLRELVEEADYLKKQSNVILALPKAFSM